MKLKNRVALWFLVVPLMFLLSGCIYNISLLPKVGPLRETVVSGKGIDKIALIDISGFISKEKPSGLIEQPDMVSRLKEELTAAAKDNKVKAILLRINSPGGTITASDLIYHEVLQFKKKTGKKVIVSILDLGASGAYYIAMAADKIVVHPTSVIGSIGVIMMHVNFEGLMKKVGVSAEAIKSGPLKDMGTPMKPLTPESRGVLQGVIDDMYERFLLVIVENRKNLSADQIRKLADGRVYTASEALKFGLVDQIGYLQEAIELTQAEAGISEAKVILYSRGEGAKNNIYSQVLQKAETPFSAWGINPKQLLQAGSPNFLYLWMP